MFPYSFFVSLSRSKFYTTPSILCRNLVDLHLGIDLAKLDLIKKWSFASIPCKVSFLSQSAVVLAEKGRDCEAQRLVHGYEIFTLNDTTRASWSVCKHTDCLVIAICTHLNCIWWYFQIRQRFILQDSAHLHSYIITSISGFCVK